jgi:hypothetical protein
MTASSAAAPAIMSQTAANTVRGLPRTGPQPHPRRALEQVDGGLGARPLLALLGAGHQHREDLFGVLEPEPLRVPRQQPPVSALQARRLAARRGLLGLAHAVPPARFTFSRRSAVVAWECSRAASAASRFPPSGVSR